MTTDRTAQRDQFVAAYRAALDGLLAATDGLDEAAWRADTGCPGWDVHDHLAHCTGVERNLLGDPDLDPDVEVPDLPHLRHDIGRYVERDVQARRGLPHGELRAEARDAFARRLVALEQLTPDQLTQETRSLFGPMRMASWLRMRLFDLACHERDIRAAVGRLDGLSGEHVPIIVEQALRSWARTLPTRVDDAVTVRFEIAGEDVADLDLGSGTLSRGGGNGEAPAATLRLTPADALALAGGRSDAPELDALEHRGDEELLGRLIVAAGVTP
ncbi:maleylpyruvate isomerase family mycothiol-dependent enzyme [Nitriliruptor alkaliphilus]|uniref:maleylpyruvate isomerase family mycothiol-dependent enzyme n=1 Tax=Nitriliruptor alkaliphilus TaxID=427918 RepID=UPI0006982FBD|nr:maleylpyruvate isomerase family mycothiol-dependent enzyme [Nitriliruptor alkaliphilus]